MRPRSPNTPALPSPRRFSPALLLLAACAPAACAPADPGVDPGADPGADVATHARPLYDSDGEVQLAPGTALPHGAVGLVGTPAPPGQSGGACSGTLIARDVVLTAGHCFCRVKDQGLSEAYIANNTSFSLPATTGQAAWPDFAGPTVVDVDTFYDGGLCGNPILSQAVASLDVACLHLSAPVPLDRVPALPGVYTGSDFIEAYEDKVATGSDDGVTAVGYGGTSWQQGNGGNTPLRRSGPVRDVIYWAGFGGRYIVSTAPDEEGETTIAPGDSGGPLMVQEDDGGWTVFGIASMTVNDLVQSSHVEWSPSWDGGRNNGKFIRNNCLVDDDGDLVSDRNDNCTPGKNPACDYDPSKCKNFDQSDVDGDGVGDVCDNCPAVANADQSDLDGDSRGDVCDNCPHHASWSDADLDGDGVGDVCDNCPKTPNGYGACPKGNQVCTCLVADDQTWGTCSKQRDDEDSDGFGDVCDVCPEHPAGAYPHSNSNWVAELREQEAVLGDACDPVPVYESRPLTVKLPSFDAGEIPLLDPPGDGVGPNDVAVFEAAALVGSTTPGVTATPRLEKHGFRHCSCLTTVDGAPALISELDCLDVVCGPDPADYDKDATMTPWQPVSVSKGWSDTADTAFVPPASGPVLSPGDEFSATFTGALTTSPYVFQDLDGALRIGQRELIAWHWRADVEAGRVEAALDEDSGWLRTGGIWWDHVLVTLAAGAPSYVGGPGGRDGQSAGHLRDHFTQLVTPLVVGDASFDSSALVDCALPGCVLDLRPWLSQVNPDPTLAARLGSIFDVVGGPARVVSAADGRFVAVGAAGARAREVGPGLSAELRRLLDAPGAYTFATPVESESLARAAAAPYGVAVPAALGRGAAIVALEETAAGLGLAGAALEGGVGRALGAARTTNEAEAGVEPDAEAGLEPREGARGAGPTERTGHRVLYSARERSVLVVGGESPRGQPSGDVWRYSLDGRRFERLFAGSAQFPLRVRGAAWAPASGRLVVADWLEPSPAGFLQASGRGERGAREARTRRTPAERHPLHRLVAFDVHGGGATPLSACRRESAYAKVALVGLDDGRFVLVGQHPVPRSTRPGVTTAPRLEAWRFSVTAEGAVRWEGRARARGVLLDGALNTDRGVWVPVGRDGRQDAWVLGEDAFRAVTAGPREFSCAP